MATTVSDKEIKQELKRLSKLPGRKGLAADNEAQAKINAQAIAQRGLTEDIIVARVEMNATNEGLSSKDRKSEEFRLRSEAISQLASEIIPGARETLIHKFFKNPFQRIGNESVSFPFNFINRSTNFGYAKRSDFVPFGLFAKNYVRPAIAAVDKAIKTAGIISPVIELHKQLTELRIARSQTGDPDEINDINKKTEAAVRGFSKNHGQKFKTLGNDLKIISDNIGNSPGLRLGKGKAGITIDQQDIITKQINHYKQLCDAVAKEDFFVGEYKNNAAFFSNPAVGITGGIQLYTKMALDADLRITARDHTTRIRNGELLADAKANPEKYPKGTVLKEGFTARLANRIKSALGFDPSPYYVWDPSIKGFFGKSRALLRTSLKDLPGGYVCAIQNGDDGLLYDKSIGQWDRKLENIEASERGLTREYYNPHIRTTPVIVGKDARENAERFGIKINKFLQMNAVKGAYQNEQRPEDALLSLFDQIYECGHDYDGMHAGDRLNSEQGAGPNKIPASVPPNFLTKLDEKIRDPNIPPHKKFFWERLRKTVGAEGHAPDKYHQRWQQRVFKLLTDDLFGGRIAPDRDLMGTPGYLSYVRKYKQGLVNKFVTFLTGVKEVEPPEGKQKEGQENQEPYLEWVKPAPEGAGAFGRTKHYTLQVIKRVLMTPVHFTKNVILLPFTLAAGAWKHLGRPIYGHIWRGLSVSAVGVGMVVAGENLIEQGTGHELPLDLGSKLVDTATFAGKKTAGAVLAYEEIALNNVLVPAFTAGSWVLDKSNIPGISYISEMAHKPLSKLNSEGIDLPGPDQIYAKLFDDEDSSPGSDWTFGSHGKGEYKSDGGQSVALKDKKEELRAYENLATTALQLGKDEAWVLANLAPQINNLKKQVDAQQAIDQLRQKINEMENVPFEKRTPQQIAEIESLNDKHNETIDALSALRKELDDIAQDPHSEEQPEQEEKPLSTAIPNTGTIKNTGLAGAFNGPLLASAAEIQPGELARFFGVKSGNRKANAHQIDQQEPEITI